MRGRVGAVVVVVGLFWEVKREQEGEEWRERRWLHIRQKSLEEVGIV